MKQWREKLHAKFEPQANCLQFQYQNPEFRSNLTKGDSIKTNSIA